MGSRSVSSSDEFFCAVADAVLPMPLFRAVCADVERLSTLPEQEPLPGALTAGSYWLPSTGRLPLNTLEQAALFLARSEPVIHDQLGSTLLGIEYWWQEQERSEAPKGFHTDRSGLMVDGSMVSAHPAMSTVLYLGDEGGATVVFDQGPGENGVGLRPACPRRLAVCPPMPNRLLAFKGDRYHGVLHGTSQGVEWVRRTVVLNWWTVVPPVASPPPASFQTTQELTTNGGALSSAPTRSLMELELCTPPAYTAKGDQAGAEATAKGKWVQDAEAWQAQHAPAWALPLMGMGRPFQVDY